MRGTPGALVLLLLGLASPVHAQDEEVRTVKVKIAADQAMRRRDGWEKLLRDRIEAASRVFERNYGVRFEVQDTVAWEAREEFNEEDARIWPDNVWALIRDLAGKVKAGKDAIVAGFTGQPRTGRTLGVAQWFGDTFVVTDVEADGSRRSEQDVRDVLLHEIAHLFGMFHVPVKASRMYFSAGQNQKFCDQSLSYIRLMKQHSFAGIGAVKAEVLRKLNEIYEEGHRPGEGSPLSVGLQARGRWLEYEGKTDQAIPIYREALKVDAENNKVRVRLAVLLRDKGDFEGAIVEFREVLKRDPKEAFGRRMLGEALRTLGRYEEAAGELQEAVRAAPDDAEAHRTLAEVFAKLGRLDEALARLREAVRLSPSHFLTIQSLVRLYHRLERPADAVAELRARVQAAPESFNLRWILADLLVKRGEYAKAEAEYREMIRIFPSKSNARMGLAKLYRDKLSRPDDALALFTELIQENPGDWYVAPYRVDLGRCYARKGALKEALRELRESERIRREVLRILFPFEGLKETLGPCEQGAKALEALSKDPKNVSAHLELGKAYKALDLPDRSVRAYREAVRIDPDNVAAHTALAYAMIQELKWDECIAEIRELIRINPGAASLQKSLATLTEFGEKVKNARDAIESAPRDAKPRQELGALLVSRNLLLQAVVELREAVRLDPDLLAAQQLLGEVFYRLEEYEEAQAPLRRAVRLEATDWKTQMMLGMTLRKLGWHNEAAVMLRKVVNQNPAFKRLWREIFDSHMKQKEFAEAWDVLREAEQASVPLPEEWTSYLKSNMREPK